MGEFVGRIISRRNETKNTKSYVMELDRPVGFLSGQFVFLHADVNGQEDKRAYSIATSPEEDKFMLTIKASDGGRFAPYFIREAGTGHTVKMTGPFGQFVLNGEKRDCVFLASGSGVVPFRSMMMHLASSNPNAGVHLFYSVKTTKDIIYKKELLELLGLLPNLRVYFSVTQENGFRKTIHPRVKYYSRRIDEKIVGENVGAIGNKIYYICGSNGFVGGMADVLKNIGVGEEDIMLEHWNFT